MYTKKWLKCQKLYEKLLSKILMLNQQSVKPLSESPVWSEICLSELKDTIKIILFYINLETRNTSLKLRIDNEELKEN